MIKAQDVKKDFDKAREYLEQEWVRWGDKLPKNLANLCFHVGRYSLFKVRPDIFQKSLELVKLDIMSEIYEYELWLVDQEYDFPPSTPGEQSADSLDI